MKELQRSLAGLGVHADLYDPWRHDPADYDLHHYFSTRQLSEPFPGRGSRPFLVTPTYAAGNGRTWAHRLASRIAQRRLRRQLAAASFVLPATDWEKALLERKVGLAPDRLQVLPNGIDPTIAAGDASQFWQSLGREKTGPLLLCVGRFESTKNQQLLLRAVPHLPAATLAFIGDADPAEPAYLAECKEMAATLDYDILFLPAVAAGSPILASAYAAADVYVQPSRFETFGLAAVEACAAGCALALSTGMAEKKLFSGHAAYFDPGNAAACASAIHQGLSQPRASEPRREFVARHSWEQVSLALHELYRKAVADGNPATEQ